MSSHTPSQTKQSPGSRSSFLHPWVQEEPPRPSLQGDTNDHWSWFFSFIPLIMMSIISMTNNNHWLSTPAQLVYQWIDICLKSCLLILQVMVWQLDWSWYPHLHHQRNHHSPVSSSPPPAGPGLRGKARWSRWQTEAYEAPTHDTSSTQVLSDFSTL